MTIYEAMGIEELLINIPIPKDTILQNIQNSPLSWSAKSYFNVIDRVVLRASIHRLGDELQVLEINLNEPKYIQEISLLVQTAIKYRILFVFTYDDRYLIVRRNFRLTETTDHVYSEYLSYTTEWLYKENLVAEIICNYQVAELDNEEDVVLAVTSSYWIAEDAQTRFYQVFGDILNNIGQLNQCMIDSDVLSLRQFCDWYIGHSAKEKLDLLSILKSIIDKSGMQYVEGTMFFDKNIIIYTIAELENTKYLRSLDHFGRHPFSYFDNITPINENEIEDVILQFIHAEPELSIDEKLAKNYEGFIDDTIRKYFELVGRPPVLSAEKERMLLEQMQDGDEEAREILIKSNLKLVVSIAKQYVNNGVALDDLIQEGTLGLISALEKYDTWYGNRIATYAKFWIQRAIHRAIMDQGSLIRLPEHFNESIEKVQKAQRDLVFSLGHEATVSDIASHLNMSDEKVRELLKFADGFIDFEEPINKFGETAIDLAIDDESETIDECIDIRELRRNIDSALVTLTPREEYVLRLRYGLTDGRTRSYEEVGHEFHYSRERIRQIEAKALRKMRHPSRSRYLREFLYTDCAPNNGFIGLAQEDYSTPNQTYINEIINRRNLIRNWHMCGYHIVEEAKLSHSIIRKLRNDGYDILEQLQNIEYDTLNMLTRDERIELLYYLDRVHIRLTDCDKETYPNIDDFFKEIIRCEECGASLVEGDWSIEKKVCNHCRQRLDRIYTTRRFDVLGKIAIFSVAFSARFVLNAYIQDDNDEINTDDLSILSVALVSNAQKALFSNNCFIGNQEDDSEEECEIKLLSARWRWDLGEFDFDEIAHVHLVVRDKADGTDTLFVFSLEEKSDFIGRKLFGVELYDVQVGIDYSKYEFNENKYKATETLERLKADPFTKRAIELCIKNADIQEISEWFNTHYKKIECCYYDFAMTRLIACIPSADDITVEIADGTQVIGSYAFDGVKIIKKLIFTNSVKIIEEYAFSGVEFVEDIILPNSIAEIGTKAFSEARIPSDGINIPLMIESLEADAFPRDWSLYCPCSGSSVSPNIKEIIATTQYDFHFKDAMQTIIDQGEFCEFDWVINASFELHITGEGRFAPVVWGICKDEGWLKYAHRIKTIIFSPGIVSVSGNAFMECNNISEVVFPSTIQFIDTYALKNTAWYNNIDAHYAIIGDGCLIKVNTENSTLIIPGDIKYISGLNDMSHNVKHISLGKSTQKLLGHAFSNLHIESILFNEGLLELEYQCLASCDELRFICLPNSVKHIGNYAFSNSRKLRWVVLPEKLESIAHNAFDDCYSLNQIIVPFDEEQFKKKVRGNCGNDKFPYSKCVYSTTVEDRYISMKSEMITRKRTKLESRPMALYRHPAISEALAKILRKYGLHTIEDLKAWGAEGIWEYIYYHEDESNCKFETLVKLACACDDMSDINEERLNQLYDFADSVVGYKLERKYIASTVDNERIRELIQKYPHLEYSIRRNSKNLVRMHNIGEKLQARLNDVGIITVPDMLQTETEVIWDKLYSRNSSTNSYEIYAIEGARCGKRVDELDPERKAALKAYVETRKGKICITQDDLISLPNIGPNLAQRLIAVGISNVQEFDQLSTEEVWDKLFNADSNTDVWEIYSVDSAKCRQKINDLSRFRKEVLKEYVVSKKVSPVGRLAEEQRKAEEARLAEERRKAEEARLAEERHKAEEIRRSEDKRKQELYSYCKQTFNKSNDIILLTDTVVKLESIIDWQDVQHLISKIQNKIGCLQNEEQKVQYRMQKVCQHCGNKFKGIFSKRCSVCGKLKDY